MTKTTMDSKDREREREREIVFYIKYFLGNSYHTCVMKMRVVSNYSRYKNKMKLSEFHLVYLTGISEIYFRI